MCSCKPHARRLSGDLTHCKRVFLRLASKSWANELKEFSDVRHSNRADQEVHNEVAGSSCVRCLLCWRSSQACAAAAAADSRMRIDIDKSAFSWVMYQNGRIMYRFAGLDESLSSSGEKGALQTPPLGMKLECASLLCL